MVHRSTLKTARSLLERFFRDAEGRTNHKLDVGFVLADLGLTREKADPGIDYLVSRGLLNTFGPEVAFLTEDGVRVTVDDVDIESLGPARSFGATPEPEAADDGSSAPAAPHLVHVALDGATSVVPLGARCTIGRAADSDVPIDDKRASKRHAVVRYERGGYVLEDLESANGTLLNGGYCVEPTRLSNDDEIVIGRTMLVYQAPETFPPPPGAEDSLPPPSRLEVSGAPTERPGPISGSLAPELAEPGIRVVRGRPDPSGPSSSPSALFSESRDGGGADDVFGAHDDVLGASPARERLGPGPLGLGPEAPASADDSPFELGPLESDLSDSDDLGDLGAGDYEDVNQPDPPPTLTARPDLVGPNQLDPGALFDDEEPTRVPDSEPREDLRPTLLGDDGGGGAPAADLEAEEPVLELSDVVEADSSSTLELDYEPHLPPGAVPSAPGGPEQTDTLTMDVGAEALPLATTSFPNALEDDDPPTIDTYEDDELGPPPPRFLAALARLREEVIGVAGPDESPLLQSIDHLARHPLVRAFAEEDDPQR